MRLFLSVGRGQRNPLEVEQATAYYCQALALAEELGMRPLQAHCYLGLDTLYAKTGQQEQACAMGMTFWLHQAQAVLAQTGGVETPAAGYINRRSASRSANRRHALHFNQEIGLGETGDDD